MYSFCLSVRPFVRLFVASFVVLVRVSQVVYISVTAEHKSLIKQLSDVLFIMLINGKMPTIAGILSFMSIINFMVS